MLYFCGAAGVAKGLSEPGIGVYKGVAVPGRHLSRFKRNPVLCFFFASVSGRTDAVAGVGAAVGGGGIRGEEWVSWVLPLSSCVRRITVLGLGLQSSLTNRLASGLRISRYEVPRSLCEFGTT